jgi:hypothetical protein
MATTHPLRAIQQTREPVKGRSTASVEGQDSHTTTQCKRRLARILHANWALPPEFTLEGWKS